MQKLRRITAADVGRAEAAAALDAVFAQYVVPISFSEPAYAAHVIVNDIDLAASPIWYDDDNVVAAAILGVRGKRGWIGGFGLVPSHRGRGLARGLLADVLERARRLEIESVTLEVLGQNPAAKRTYLAGGFTRTRGLLIYDIDPKTLDVTNPDAPYAGVDQFLDVPEDVPPCWQLDGAVLRKHAKHVHAVGDERAFCIFQHDGKQAQLLKVRAPTPDRLAWLVASVATQAGVERVGLFGVPEDSQTAAGARSLGWNIAHEAEEMRLHL